MFTLLEKLFHHERKRTDVTCDQQFLEIMQSGDWVSTDDMVDKGIIDYKTAKYHAKLKGYIFDRKTEGKRPGKKNCKGDRYKTFYKLVARVPECHRKIEKRNYISKFSNEEIISELWSRNMLSGKLMDGEVVHFLSE